MPTAGRLTGAILFGALAWYVSGLIVPLFPEGTDLGYFVQVNTVIGVICGWRLAGPRAGAGYLDAISYGVTTTIAMLVVALFINSLVVMIENSLRRLYDTPVEAVVAIFELMLEHGRLMATPEIAATLALGGILAGLGTDVIGRRYS